MNTSIGGNANYTHIQAHGTPGAFEPGWIAQAATVGPPGDPQPNPFYVIDVVVDVSHAEAGTFFELADPIAPGSTVTIFSVNGDQSIVNNGDVPSTYTIGFAAASQPSPIDGSVVPLPTFFAGVGFGGGEVAAKPPAPVDTINGGITISTPFLLKENAIPVVYVVTANATKKKRDVGHVHVKFLVFTP